jgi:hypothetical protein
VRIFESILLDVLLLFILWECLSLKKELASLNMTQVLLSMMMC